MNCIVTAGPTYESLDEVRRLTNFSTGKLGTELANFLVEQGHHVTLLCGYYSIHRGEQKAQQVQTFTTTTDLRVRLHSFADNGIDAIYHAAAVSDFTFGKIWERSPEGTLTECKSGKVSTRQGTLLAELVPTPKIISGLRDVFRKAKIIGWKYEVEGDRANVIAKGEKQIEENRTNACVVNGKAYGPGFGVVTGAGQCAHFSDMNLLYVALEELGSKA
jgi:phosphopantothenoylcysteine synthetase/decarboxylase